MKQGMNKNIYILAITIIIILVGIIVTATLGFNKELRFSESQKIDIYISHKVNVNKIKDIANEVLGRENIVQIVEVYEDMVTIRAKSITEEQKNNIVNKIKENYQFEQTAEKTIIENVPSTRLRDIYKKYIMPFAISWVLILIYMIVRYRKIGMVKVITRTLMVPVIGEALLASIIAIARIPVGRFTPVLSIAVYLFTILYVTNKNEKTIEEQ